MTYRNAVDRVAKKESEREIGAANTILWWTDIETRPQRT